MSGKTMKRRHVENPSNPGSELRKRRCKDWSQKNSEEQIASTQLSIFPDKTQIVFVILEIFMHTLEGLVMKTMNETMDMKKDQLFEEMLIKNIICVFLKYTHLDEDTTDLLKRRINCVINKISEEKDNITAIFFKLGKDVESIYQNLQEMFPNIECVQLMSKAIEVNCGDEIVWNSIISDLQEINHTIEPRAFTKHEFFPSQEHLIPEEMKIHYYIASNQFHRMMSKVINMPKKQVFNPCDSIESITYIHNEKLESAYEYQKEVFKQQNKVDQHGNVIEFLLFHGTAAQSIESIVATNFLVDCLPHPEKETVGEGRQRKKAMLFGKGIYFSELPAVSLMYGTGLLLCKVVLGSCEMYKPKGELPKEIPEIFDSREVIKDGVGIVHVVKNPCQILPYCIIKLTNEALFQNLTPKLLKFQQGPITRQSMPDRQRTNSNSFGFSYMPQPILCFEAECKSGACEDDVKITADEMSLLTMDRYTSAVATLNTEDCKICLEKLENESSFDETFGIISLNTCRHKFHSGCVKMMVKAKDYIQCPTCRTIHGTKTGDQPLAGQMTWNKNTWTIPGYPNCGMIIITYNMMPGIQTAEHLHPGTPYHVHGFPRTAFLPDNQQGNTVLKMMITAFQRRLTFSVGTSLTAGRDDFIVWNGIQHKTKVVKNGDGHGYPDMEYLDRVTEELENIGVKQY